jgi:RimJ/RimL family protein N-acetyltransferase
MSNLYLRKAELVDLDMYYNWANDPVVRSNSFNTEQIPYEDHVIWFNEAIKRDDVALFVLMDDDMPVGQIRINISDAVAEISYSIASEFRGKGYGGKIVSLLIERIREEMPEIKTVSARVKPDNLASMKVFEKIGFKRREMAFELDVN